MEQLKCEHCNKMFEISNATADAMTRWRDASGEPIVCGDCATKMEETHAKTLEADQKQTAGTQK